MSKEFIEEKSLEIKSLSFSYGKREILKDINFSLEKGSICALLGPNGVGKTTLFSCILKLNKLSSGRVYINGIDIEKHSHKEIASSIAYIPQFHESVFNFTVLEMVLMGVTAAYNIFAQPREEDCEKARLALKRMGIEDFEDRIYANLSGGEKQLVLIARALAQDSNILIMDEPTASLDYGNQIRVMEKIKKLASDGYTVIFSTHSPDQALMYSDRVLALKDGYVYSKGKTRDVIDANLIMDLYGVKAKIMETMGGTAAICVPCI